MIQRHWKSTPDPSWPFVFSLSTHISTPQKFILWMVKKVGKNPKMQVV